MLVAGGLVTSCCRRMSVEQHVRHDADVHSISRQTEDRGGGPVTATANDAERPLAHEPARHGTVAGGEHMSTARRALLGEHTTIRS